MRRGLPTTARAGRGAPETGGAAISWRWSFCLLVAKRRAARPIRGRGPRGGRSAPSLFGCDSATREGDTDGWRARRASLLTLRQSSRPRDPPIEGPVLDRLGEVDGLDRTAAVQVGDRAGDLEHAVERAGGEAEALEGGLQEGAAFG